MCVHVHVCTEALAWVGTILYCFSTLLIEAGSVTQTLISVIRLVTCLFYLGNPTSAFQSWLQAAAMCIWLMLASGIWIPIVLLVWEVLQTPRTFLGAPQLLCVMKEMLWLTHSKSFQHVILLSQNRSQEGVCVPESWKTKPSNIKILH